MASLHPMLALRHRTAGAHQQLEDELDLLSPDLDIERYGDVLVMMASVYEPLEAAIAAVLPAELEGRRKVPALHADLAALGRSLPAPLPIPPIEGRAAALGALYVTEGATLGGALIAEHVAVVLGASTPLAFFRAYGADVPRRWSQFRAIARALLATPADIDRAADTADAVFTTFLAAVPRR